MLYAKCTGMECCFHSALAVKEFPGQVPPMLKMLHDSEARLQDKLRMLTNSNKARDMRFFRPDKTTGKGKLKLKKKAATLFLLTHC